MDGGVFTGQTIPGTKKERRPDERSRAPGRADSLTPVAASGRLGRRREEQEGISVYENVLYLDEGWRDTGPGICQNSLKES